MIVQYLHEGLISSQFESLETAPSTSIPSLVEAMEAENIRKARSCGVPGRSGCATAPEAFLAAIWIVGVWRTGSTDLIARGV